MADISQVTTLDGTTYDIKDATARTLLSGHSVGVNVPSNAVFTDTVSPTVTVASSAPASAASGDVWFKVVS